MSRRTPSSSTQAKRKRTVSETSTGLESSIEASLPVFASQPHGSSQISHHGDALEVSELDEETYKDIPDFPHRRLPSITRQRGRRQSDEKRKSRSSRSQSQAQDRVGDNLGQGQLGILVRSIYRFLDLGQISKAARAYGLALQQRPNGKPVDVRRHDLWALGAEVIMREGEEQRQITYSGSNHDNQEGEQAGNVPKTTPHRWGSAANIGKLKAYFETLVEQYPYNPRSPQSVSALDFHIAMFNCEIYNAHTEHVACLFRLDHGHDHLDDGDDVEVSAWGTKVKRRKDALRSQALNTMGDVIRRMDRLMQKPPYSQDHEILRLRAVASLYTADLMIPMIDQSEVTLKEAKNQREMEMATAIKALQMVVDSGGELDPVSLALVHQEDVEQEEYLPQLYSSLPIRKSL